MTSSKKRNNHTGHVAVFAKLNEIPLEKDGEQVGEVTSRFATAHRRNHVPGAPDAHWLEVARQPEDSLAKGSFPKSSDLHSTDWLVRVTLEYAIRTDDRDGDRLKFEIIRSVWFA